jgi:DNA primase
MGFNNIKQALELNKRFLSLSTPALEHPKVRKYLVEKRNCPEELIETFDLRFKNLESVFRDSLSEDEFELANVLGLIVEDEETGKLRDCFRTCLVLPFMTPHGVIAFGFRRLGEKQYMNSTRSAVFTKDWSFYGLTQALPKILETGWIIIVEGYFDVLRMHALGFTNTIGVAGTAVSYLRISAARRFADNFLLLFDGDEGGEKAKIRTKKQIKQLGARAVVLTLPEGEDPDSFGLNHPKRLNAKIRDIIE